VSSEDWMEGWRSSTSSDTFPASSPTPSMVNPASPLPTASPSLSS
jgi:hypothetical protein